MEKAQEEQNLLSGEVEEFTNWSRSTRFKYTTRPYTPSDVISLRGSNDLNSIPLSNVTARKLYNLCRRRFNNKRYTHTFGALDPVQVTQMAKYLETVYVSGWQCSSTASTSNEPGPDFADYPANTVPNKVDQLFRAQRFHDRKQREERFGMSLEMKANKVKVDYFRPIIADGDTGFGGITAVMKMVKMQIEAGAAGVHIEDQKGGAKKCGHMGGKVLVSVREHVDRLAAARLQADILGCETVVIARTDACGATFLETNIDPRDHPFIAGSCNKDIGNFEGNANQEGWLQRAGLCRYTDCIAKAMEAKKVKQDIIQDWIEKSMKMSNSEARDLAKSLGFGDVFWCWEAPRSREGFYRVIGGVDYSVMRAIAFSPLADLIWMETATPDIKEAELFATEVHAAKPHQMLAYNLSPSFNWDADNRSNKDIIRFQKDLGKLGFAWQFITLAGFHANALAIDSFAREYAGKKGVYAYVEQIQREERRLGVETLLHQKWSGAQYMDKVLEIASGGMASTLSLEGATEDQFGKHKESHEDSTDYGASETGSVSSAGESDLEDGNEMLAKL